MRKAYSEDRAAESRFNSAANITHIALAMSVGHAYTKLNRVYVLGMPEYEAIIA